MGQRIRGMEWPTATVAEKGQSHAIQPMLD